MKTNFEFDIEFIEENGVFSCFIPKYKINFNTRKREDIERKAKILLTSYFNFLHDENINGNIKFKK